MASYYTGSNELQPGDMASYYTGSNELQPGDMASYYTGSNELQPGDMASYYTGSNELQPGDMASYYTGSNELQPGDMASYYTGSNEHPSHGVIGCHVPCSQGTCPITRGLIRRGLIGCYSQGTWHPITRGHNELQPGDMASYYTGSNELQGTWHPITRGLMSYMGHGILLHGV